MMKSYTEMTQFETFEDRFRYLKLEGRVGDETFGRSRSLNQIFYQSPRWRQVRDQVILRDKGCDLGIPGMTIHSRGLIHHINPISENDIREDSDSLYDLDNLVLTTYATHNAIHYGDEELARVSYTLERTPNDTCPWKR